MKNKILCLCLLLFYCFSNLHAQNKMAKKQNTIKIERSDVVNIGYKNNDFFVQNSNMAFLYNKDGKFVKKIMLDNNQSKFSDADMKYSISTDGRIIEISGMAELANISDKLKDENKISKYLAKSDKYFLSCLVDSENLSYSNGIFKISDSEFSLLTYIVGIPAGLFVEGNTLWYLYHKSVPESNGMLRKYDLATGELLLELEVPVIEPVGLYIHSDICYLYSNYSKELVTLNIGGQ